MNEKIAVIFDMDGVLVDNSTYHDESWKVFCEKHGVKVSDEELKKKFGSNARKYLTDFFGPLDDKKVRELTEEKEEIYRQIYAPHIQLPNGLRPLLDELIENKVPMAIATSGPLSNVNFVLDKTDIRKYISCVVDDSLVTKGKPDPTVFNIAVQKLGMDASKCLIFEDSPMGIEAALNAGVKVVGITSTHPEETIIKATHIINSFTEVNLEKIRNLILNGTFTKN